jgi:hypothetical protein
MMIVIETKLTPLLTMMIVINIEQQSQFTHKIENRES